jgi:hypothetical protein
VQERDGNTLEATGMSKDFFSRNQLTQQQRERINKWDYMKLKSFCTTKQIDFKLKRLPTEWEEIFNSYASDKEMIARTYREVQKSKLPKKSMMQ